MLRGTRAAQAYIATTVDGSGVNKGLVDAVDDATDHMDEAGDEGGRRYGARFSSRFKERLENIRNDAARVLNDRLGLAGREAGEKAGDEAGEGLVNRVVDKVRSSGDRISAELGDRLASRPEQIRRGVDRAFDDDFADRIGGRLGDRLAEAIGDRIELALAMANDSLDETLSRIAVSGNRDGGRSSGGRDTSRGDRLGSLFGAGSRNNFLNTFGKSVGGIINLMESAKNSLGSLFNAMKSGEGIGKGLTSSITSLGAALPSAAAAAAALSVALALMVSVGGALLGIVTALTSTIASGLVGALAVSGGLLGAVAVAGGLAAVAFTSMTDAQKKLLSDAFRPLKAELTGIGQLMLNEMVPSFAIWSSNLQEALYLLAPLAQVMGSAFAEAGEILTASLSGPGFQMLTQQLGVFLPSIVTRLSGALGQFLNGTASLFSALLPYVNQFAGYLEKVATRFANWAASAQGQNQIEDFVDRALVSLQSLMNFVGEFAGFIADVLFSPEAQNAGNTLFDDLTDAFEGFRKAIADGRLEQWFADAIEFAEALGDVMVGLGDAFAALYDSGVITAIAKTLTFLGDAFSLISDLSAPTINLFGVDLPNVLAAVIAPLTLVTKSISGIGDAVGWVMEKLGRESDNLGGIIQGLVNRTIQLNDLSKAVGQAAAAGASGFGSPQVPNMSDIIKSGTTALNSTSTKNGGYKAPSSPAKYNNPYTALANSLIKDGPTVAQQIRKAIQTVNKQVQVALAEAARSLSGTGTRDALRAAGASLMSQGADAVQSAQSALNSAAQRLASASSAKEARRALAEVKRAQQDLIKAQAAQSRINSAAKLLNQSAVLNSTNINRLVEGLKVSNASLADFARAREILATKIEAAQQKVADAIALRNDYTKQITDATRAFGALTTAQASTINGIEQALTATDITTNLQDRLDKIKTFQSNLRLLLAQGLSESAYKQILDAGVDGGSAYAAALVAGGSGAVSQVNSLVSQIDSAAASLGATAGTRMYQAGVDAAKGLLAGLQSIDKQLATASAKLGATIANAIKKSLGISSPARVMIDMMDNVGDGTVIGLGNQHNKVGAAASALAGQIPIAASLGARYAADGVNTTAASAQGGDQHHWHITTPTEDPKAVAQEMINEMTGRLP